MPRSPRSHSPRPSARALRWTVSRCVALVLSVSLLGLADTAHAGLVRIPPPTDVSPTQSLREFRAETMHAINLERRRGRRDGIRRYDTCLTRLAQRWATSLAASGGLFHRDQGTVLRRCDLEWTGEILVRGGGMLPRTAVGAWMDSPGHREILMHRRSRVVGVGVAVADDGQRIVVVNFGQR
jgi:uncharacterized protein YkwD